MCIPPFDERKNVPTTRCINNFVQVFKESLISIGFF